MNGLDLRGEFLVSYEWALNKIGMNFLYSLLSSNELDTSREQDGQNLAKVRIPLNIHSHVGGQNGKKF
jgi:hypothetical protein